MMLCFTANCSCLGPFLLQQQPMVHDNSVHAPGLSVHGLTQGSHAAVEVATTQPTQPASSALCDSRRCMQLPSSGAAS